MANTTILDIRRLWLALRRILASRSLIQRLVKWGPYFWSLLRLRSPISCDRHDSYETRLKSVPPPPPTSRPRAEDDMATSSVSTIVLHQNIVPPYSTLGTISLSDASIAFSEIPHSVGEATTGNIPLRPIPVRAFSRSDSALHSPHSLGDELYVPGMRRGFELSAPHLPFSDEMSLHVPELDSLRLRRTRSPAPSIIHPLPLVEGPAGMPTRLLDGLSDRTSERFSPLIPYDHGRYSRGVKVLKKTSMPIELEPMSTNYPPVYNPPGWTPYLHPEGVRYFCDTERRIYTDANLYEEGMAATVERYIEEIYAFMSVNSIVLSPTADLVLDIVDDTVHYYFADHRNRTVFYLDKMNTSNFSTWFEVEGASCMRHFGYIIEAEYWWHVFLFPSSLTINEDVVNELRDMVIHGLGDTMTAEHSTSTYSGEELHKLLSVTNSLKENIGTSYGGSVCMLSRYMWGFTRHRFLHWHGHPAARLARDSSAHSNVKVRSLMMRIVSWLLFSAPDVHLRNLEKIWVDKLMYEYIWKQLIQKLITEWQEFTLFSTVLLNANVAFLAIQTIDQNNHPYRSPGQIASYLSITVSIGSIILSLLLVRITRTKIKDTAQQQWDFLAQRAHPKYGLELLAIVYSLPYALLMWGVIGFLAAIAWMCMENASTLTRTLTGIAWFIIAIMAVLCVWMGWEPRPEDERTEFVSDDVSASPNSSRTSTIGASLRKLSNIFQFSFFQRSPAMSPAVSEATIV